MYLPISHENEHHLYLYISKSAIQADINIGSDLGHDS